MTPISPDDVRDWLSQDRPRLAVSIDGRTLTIDDVEFGSPIPFRRRVTSHRGGRWPWRRRERGCA